MIFFLVGMCFGAGIGLFVAGLLASSGHADELERAMDDAYADGYEQCREEYRMGIHRLPTHRP